MHKVSKRLLFFMLAVSGAFRLARWASRGHVAVLTYHRVLPDGQGAAARNSVCRSEFERQIAYLARRYHVATGEEFRSFLTAAGSLPQHSVLITFDDGYENNYTVAFPILQKYGLTATFFLTTGLIGQPGGSLWLDRLDAICAAVRGAELNAWLRDRSVPAFVRSKNEFRHWLKRQSSSVRDRAITDLERSVGMGNHGQPALSSGLMSWSQAREMSAKGMTIGSHTERHQILSSSSEDEVRFEVAESRRRIQDEIGRDCWCFSYPNGEAGDFRQTDRSAIQGAGYTCAFTQVSGLVSTESDRYALPRIAVPDFADFGVFRSRVTGLHHALGVSVIHG